MPMEQTLYQLLGVDQTASQAEIERAHRELIRTVHPDLLPAGASSAELAARNRRAAAINRARDVLGDPAARASYDLGLRTTARGSPAPSPTRARPAPARAARRAAPPPPPPASSEIDDDRAAFGDEAARQPSRSTRPRRASDALFDSRLGQWALVLLVAYGSNWLLAHGLAEALGWTKPIDIIALALMPAVAVAGLLAMRQGHLDNALGDMVRAVGWLIGLVEAALGGARRRP
jgi:hypothetical protein